MLQCCGIEIEQFTTVIKLVFSRNNVANADTERLKCILFWLYSVYLKEKKKKQKKRKTSRLECEMYKIEVM